LVLQQLQEHLVLAIVELKRFRVRLHQLASATHGFRGALRAQRVVYKPVRYLDILKLTSKLSKWPEAAAPKAAAPTRTISCSSGISAGRLQMSA